MSPSVAVFDVTFQKDWSINFVYFLSLNMWTSRKRFHKYSHQQRHFSRHDKILIYSKTYLNTMLFNLRDCDNFVSKMRWSQKCTSVIQSKLKRTLHSPSIYSVRLNFYIVYKNCGWVSVPEYFEWYHLWAFSRS